MKELETIDLTVQNRPLDIVGQTFTPKFNLSFHSDSRDLGKFFEDENGRLSFEGDVNESAKVFADHFCELFNDRIEEIKKESKNEI